jgi:cation diffusion facilitator CzcD-associated flavoprotein CzcO
MVQTRSGGKRKNDKEADDSGKDRSQVEEKYKKERTKRLRRDGINQYRKINEESLKHFAEDPWAKSDQQRQSLQKHVDVLIIGAGWGGILTAIRLLEVGIKNFLILDKASAYGGVWYWNRYPGLHCDTESYIYMPLLEETGYMPTEKYATGPEIREYANQLAKQYGLREKTLFGAQATGTDWNESTATWTTKTKQGDEIKSRYFVSAGGSLHLPKLPPLPGIESFKGHSFHSSRWDYEYTGGDINGNLDKLKGKRVGVIGTGKFHVN